MFWWFVPPKRTTRYDLRLLADPGPVLAREPLSLTAVDALLAHPVTEGLLDDAELAGDICHRAALVDHERGGVSAELLRITASPASARGKPLFEGESRRAQV